LRPYIDGMEHGINNRPCRTSYEQFNSDCDYVFGGVAKGLGWLLLLAILIGGGALAYGWAKEVGGAPIVVLGLLGVLPFVLLCIGARRPDR